MKYLKDKFLIVAFNITNSKYLKKIKRVWKKELIKDTVAGRDQKETEKITSDKLGGKLVLLKLSKGNKCSELSYISIKTPMGICLSKDAGSLFTGSDHWIYEIREGRVIRELNNDLFNCIHGISLTPKNTLLVASTGVDAILEIDPDRPRKNLWHWFAPENGFPISKNGEIRIIDYDEKLQGIEFSTPLHTTHLNSVLQINEDKILVTFFHQGNLVEIDKRTNKTTILLSGLKNPHGIKSSNNEHLISDTKGNRAFILDKDFKIQRQISSDFDWVQDTIFTQERDVIVADSNNGRLILWKRENNQLKKIYQYNQDELRIGSIMEVTQGIAIKIFGINNLLKTE